MSFQVGHRVIGTIKSVKGSCHAEHKVGDKLELSVYDNGGLCGLFYHGIFPCLLLLQFGGHFPEEWVNADVIELDCMDRFNTVTIELRRVGPYRPPEDIG